MLAAPFPMYLLCAAALARKGAGSDAVLGDNHDTAAAGDALEQWE